MAIVADRAEVERKKRRAATLSLAYNVFFTIAKVVAAVLTGSMSLLTEAAHSATDIAASGFALLAIRAAAAPPDDEHPYGHGKIESLAGFGESVLLLLIVCYVALEAALRLIHGGAVANVGVGLVVMAASALSSLVLGVYISRTGHEAGSMALQSNGQHLLVDFWTSAGVLAALVVTRLTGWTQADPIFALGLGAWIGFNAWRMCARAFQELIDRRLSDAECAAIQAILEEMPGILSFHKLRTRQSGYTRYVDVHIVVPAEWSVVKAHGVADIVEKKIESSFAPAVATIHVDPNEPAKTA